MYKVYVLKDTTGIRYVGITKQDLEKRLKGHISKAKNEYTHKANWLNLLGSNGELPVIEEIEIVHSMNEALEREKFWIYTFKNVYNLTNSTDGGDIINNMTLESRKKLSDTIKKKYASGYINPMKGKKRPDLILRNTTNHPFKDKTLKNKISKYFKTKYNKKKMISICRLAQKTRKPVLQLDLDGKIIKKWDSLGQISKELGFKRKSIRWVCNGLAKTAYNFKWQFYKITG